MEYCHLSAEAFLMCLNSVFCVVSNIAFPSLVKKKISKGDVAIEEWLAVKVYLRPVIEDE
jgi:hypothetical protein